MANANWDRKWDCAICKAHAKDTLSLYDQYLDSVSRVKIFNDIDGIKWVMCVHCCDWFHWCCVISLSTDDRELKFPFCAHTMAVGQDTTDSKRDK